MFQKALLFSSVRAALIGGGVGVVAEAVAPGSWWVGIVVFPLIVFLGIRRSIRRMRVVRAALPAGVEQWLQSTFPFREGIDRERFERTMKIVLSDWVFEGVGGADITPESMAGVAAGAALLLHGRPDWEWPANQTVLLYPDRFDDEYRAGESGEFDGMAHEQGPVILSVPSIADSWAYPGDGYHVVLHELAHLLDYAGEGADGVPSLVDPGSVTAWRELMHKEMRRIRIGRSMLRRYAARNSVEFFAVAVESFFERPRLMAQKHPELFVALKNLFNLDPSTWGIRERALREPP